jgi:hypothetical protein
MKINSYLNKNKPLGVLILVLVLNLFYLFEMKIPSLFKMLWDTLIAIIFYYYFIPKIEKRNKKH